MKKEPKKETKRKAPAADAGAKREALKVEMRPIGDVKPYDNNPRDNSASVPKLARLIREYGFTQPIVVDEQGVILAGHTRLAAAKELGLERVPVTVLRGVTPDQAAAYRLADNRVAEFSAWDADKLAEECNALSAAGLDLSDLDFDALLVADGAEEEAKEPKEKPEPKIDLARPQLVVECDDDADAERKFNKAAELGWKCTLSI